MKLHHDVKGRGPDLVLVHGWGLHGDIWEELATQLARNYRVTTVDLPGHGRSDMPEDAFTLATITDAVASLVSAPATWLGWSLGGFVALDAALRHAGNVAHLVLVGATPKFVQGTDWAHAMPAPVFAQFAVSLQQDYRSTLLRFLSLQAGNDEEGRALIKTLRARIFEHGEPRPEALAAGLAILEQTDMRARLADIRIPVQVIHGSHDRLAPPAAGEYLAARIAGARFVSIPGAGHAPFLSQPAAFLAALNASRP